MANTIKFMLVAMACVLVYANRAEIAQALGREGAAVERGAARERIESMGGPEEYLAGATDATDWEQRYLFLRHNAMWPSGVRDVDEAVSASVHLRDHPGRWYPKRWRDRLTEGRAWVDGMSGDGPDEEFCGASEATPPAWVGRPPGRTAPKRVSTAKALSRFVFGVDDEER